MLAVLNIKSNIANRIERELSIQLRLELMGQSVDENLNRIDNCCHG